MQRPVIAARPRVLATLIAFITRRAAKSIRFSVEHRVQRFLDRAARHLPQQDRDGAPSVLASILHAFPWLRHVVADGAYAGPKLETALKRIGRWTLEIVKRPDGARGFDILPRRWVVERTLAWLNRNRRLAKDFEATLATAQVWLFIASAQLLTRRLARH